MSLRSGPVLVGPVPVGPVPVGPVPVGPVPVGSVEDPDPYINTRGFAPSADPDFAIFP